jgi:hypothetical protein
MKCCTSTQPIFKLINLLLVASGLLQTHLAQANKEVVMFSSLSEDNNQLCLSFF